MKLIEALDANAHQVISLVGAGGKTSLMFALAGELASNGISVITTTTTKILEPSSLETPFLILESNEGKMVKLVLQNLGKYRQITLAMGRLSSGKLKGVTSDFILRLARLDQVSHIIVEADGADRKPLKAPNPSEPVVPGNTSLLIPVIGIDALGTRLTDKNVFRPEIFSNLTGLPLGDIVTAEAIALSITRPNGLIRRSPSQARIIPFINKVDLEHQLSKAKNLAKKILAAKNPRIMEVVLGQAQLPDPVLEVISMEDQ